MSHYPNHDAAYQPPPARSPSKWVWIILLVLLVLALACAGLCGGLFFLGWQSVDKVKEAVKEGARAAPPYRMASERVQADRKVKERLGEPIRDGIPSLFNYQDGTAGGNAEFRYSVTGPKGSATVHVVSEKIDDRWWFRALGVKFSDGESISLADEDTPIKLE